MRVRVCRVHCAEIEYSIWIGLYRTSAGWMRSSSCHANATNTHLSAYLTLTSIEHMVAVTNNVSASSWGREELEHCAALRTDGRLTEASCSWAGFQCLCELGSETLPEYVSMADAARLLGEERSRHLRLQVATIFSLAVALPLVMDKRIARLIPLLQLSVKVAKHAPSKMEGMRTLWMHAGWAMLVFTAEAWRTGNVWELERSPTDANRCALRGSIGDPTMGSWSFGT